MVIPDDEDDKKNKWGGQMMTPPGDEKKQWGWKNDEKEWSQTWAHQQSWNADSWKQSVTWSASLDGLEHSLCAHILGIIIPID